MCNAQVSVVTVNSIIINVGKGRELRTTEGGRELINTYLVHGLSTAIRELFESGVWVRVQTCGRIV